MALTKLIGWIQSNQIKTPKTSDEKVFQAILDTIIILIQDSRDGEDLKKLEEIILYLQSITLTWTASKFLGVTTTYTLDSHLIGEGLAVIFKKNTEQQPLSTFPPVSSQFKYILGSIHLNLMKHYQRMKSYEDKKVWSFSYPLNNQGEVMNQEIGDWQNTLMTLSKKPHLDFTRGGFRINGINTGQDNGVQVLLDNLVIETPYEKKDRQKIIEWLKKNGGQDNNRFIDLLILNHHFCGEDKSLALGKTTALEQNWYRDKNGKICLCCDMLIMTLQNGFDTLCMDNNNKIKEIFDTEELKKLQDPLPLIRIKGKIQLEVENGIVKPKMVALDVTSYTDYLQSPEKTKGFQPRQEDNPKMTRVMKTNS